MHTPLKHFQHDDRPWGSFKRFTLNQESTVKIITVEPERALSLQKHVHRDEFWYVVSGSGTFTIGDRQLPAEAGQDYYIPKNTLHRVETGDKHLIFLEIALGHFDEGDIVRIEDRYGRK